MNEVKLGWAIFTFMAAHNAHCFNLLDQELGKFVGVDVSSG